MAIKGIDVSAHNGIINWTTVSNNVDFVIIRAGYGRSATQIDKYFETNYDNAVINKLDRGAYWYSYALTPSEAKLEAQACLKVLQDKKFNYPIYYDIEEPDQLALGTAKVKAIIDAFCTELEKAGYWVGVYASASTLKKLNIGNRYAIWVAHWDVNTPDCTNYGLWQYKVGTCPGVNGQCDLDYAYIDYPKLIVNAGKNNYKNMQTQFIQSNSDTNDTINITITINDKTYTGTLSAI